MLGFQGVTSQGAFNDASKAINNKLELAVNNDFEFIVGSPLDREKLICEIYHKGQILAEISQETSELLIEIYPSQDGGEWKIPLEKFQQALENGKNHLLY